MTESCPSRLEVEDDEGNKISLPCQSGKGHHGNHVHHGGHCGCFRYCITWSEHPDQTRSEPR